MLLVTFIFQHNMYLSESFPLKVSQFGQAKMSFVLYIYSFRETKLYSDLNILIESFFIIGYHFLNAKLHFLVLQSFLNFDSYFYS